MIEFFQKLFFTQSDRLDLEERLLEARKMEAIGRVAESVAHDFNNILTAICSYNDLLASELTGSPRLLEYTSEVQKAADRAASLTRQLLVFGKRQANQPKLLDLNETIVDVQPMLRRLVGDNVHVIAHLASGLRQVRMDPTQIDQVLMNLAVNGRDAMPEGGRLTIETANVELINTFRGRYVGVEPGSYVMLAVSDTGTGMDAATKSRVFEPFFTTKDAEKGTGLGLPIVYAIVKQNGGEILVYSEPGKGTTMKIYFPAAASEATAPVAATAARAPA
jgi:two-component system, cell cycle sensor histidine kinase and response regulator CckA